MRKNLNAFVCVLVAGQKKHPHKKRSDSQENTVREGFKNKKKHGFIRVQRSKKHPFTKGPKVKKNVVSEEPRGQKNMVLEGPKGRKHTRLHRVPARVGGGYSLHPSFVHSHSHPHPPTLYKRKFSNVRYIQKLKEYLINIVKQNVKRKKISSILLSIFLML